MADFSGDEKVLVTCCNLEPLKRMPLFAEAFCKISEDIPECKWVCIGSGEDYDKIKAIIFDANLEEKVTLAGRMPNREVLEFYKNNPVTFFCNVSTSEGLPVSVMEAFSFGIPVLATDVGGTSELVNHENGLLLSPDITAEDVAKALKMLLSCDKGTYLKMRKAARSKWETDVSAEKNYKEFCKDISEL